MAPTISAARVSSGLAATSIVRGVRRQCNSYPARRKGVSVSGAGCEPKYAGTAVGYATAVRTRTLCYEGSSQGSSASAARIDCT